MRTQLPAGTPQKVVMQHLSSRYAEARKAHQAEKEVARSAVPAGVDRQ